jgi:hypothetical protein
MAEKAVPKLFGMIVRKRVHLLPSNKHTAIFYHLYPYYGITVVVWPGKVIDMTPPHTHMQVDGLSRAGWSAISTVGAPGVQGPGVFGTHGIGVNVPMAAAVADATVGFTGELHIPKGKIFTMGRWSMMFAAGAPPSITLFTGSTARLLGAAPKLHWRTAPCITCSGILPPATLIVHRLKGPAFID